MKKNNTASRNTVPGDRFLHLGLLNNNTGLIIRRVAVIIFLLIVIISGINCSGYKEKKEIRNTVAAFKTLFLKKDGEALRKMIITDYSCPVGNLFLAEWPAFNKAEISNITLKGKEEAAVELKWKENENLLRLKMNMYKQNRVWMIAPNIELTVVVK